MRRRLRWAMAVACAMMLSSAATTASAEKVRAVTEPERIWYGWQTLIIDGSVLLLLPLTGAETEAATAGLAVAVGGYAFGAPIVHFAHGNYGRGVGSFALRTALPLLAVASLASGSRSSPVSSSSSSGSDGESSYKWSIDFGPIVAVLLIGSNALAASVVDAAVLSYETREPKPHGPTLQLTPRFTPSNRSAGLVVSGTF